ncbi:MAG: hypothetical protein ABI538_00160 [Pseudoxanthomonas sp.]
MSRVFPVALLAALVVAAFTLVYANGRSQTSSTDSELKQLFESQNQILQRLDRLEASRAGNRSPGNNMGSGLGRAHGYLGDELPLMPGQIAQLEGNARRDRENKFVIEPLSAAWASRTERTIGNALAATTLAKEHAVAPTSLESTCHSQTCRISMSFPDELTANFTKVVFMEQLAETLPQVELFQETLPDGSFRYLAYANAGSAAPTTPGKRDKR